MAVIQGYNPNDPDKNKQQPAGGASTSSTGSQATGPSPSQPAQNKSQPSSGSFQNFGNYAQANKQSGERIGNVLSQNIQGQAQNVRASSGAVTEQQTAAQKEQDRIKQGLNQVRGAVDTGQGFQQFLQPAPATNAPSATQANNPVYSNLADWAQRLSTGQTDAQKIQTQGDASAMTAQRQLTGLQNQQQRLGTEPGRFQLLKDILGKTGGYSNPAARLDQALLQTNTNALDKVIKGAQSSVGAEQQNLQDKRQAFGTELSNLGTARDASLKELRGTDTEQGLLGKGLTNVDTSLEKQQKDATTKRQTEQADITKQFQDQEFDQSIADELGIGQGSTLFNILKDSPDAYKKYVDLADPSGINKSNVINQDQLLQYSALQKMLGNDTSQFAYKDVGTVDPSYTLQGNKFKGDLSNLYNTRADQADTDVASGYAQSEYSHGFMNTAHDTERAYLQANVRDMVNSQAIRDAATNFQQLQTPSGSVQGSYDQKNAATAAQRNDLQNQINAIYATGTKDLETGATNVSPDKQAQIANLQSQINSLTSGLFENTTSTHSQHNAIAGGALSGIGAVLSGGGSLLRDPAKSIGSIVSGVGGVINNLWDSITGGGQQAHAQREARRGAAAALEGNWQNYLSSRGYNDTAKIRQALQAQNKVGADVPTGLQG